MPRFTPARAISIAMATAAFAALPAHASLLISADFGPASFQGAPFRDYTGVESVAAAMDPLFSTASQWNALRFSSYTDGGPGTSPSFQNLLDSNGVATNVTFNVVGDVKSFDAAAWFNDAALNDPLRNDYVYFGHTGLATVVDFSFTGLAANTLYRFYAYGAAKDSNEVMLMTLDTNADGSFGDDMAQSVLSAGVLYATAGTQQDGYFSVFSDASGTIRGQAQLGPNGYEANWAGFQLAEAPDAVSVVPEPGSLALFSAALLLMFRASHRRRR